ncbi:MAG: calcium-binding protein [Oscillatoriales cyanobacterium RU_3_3]|nr:calcium-binding protein [Oscillatoriales cyanobacterium RU_3_3]
MVDFLNLTPEADAFQIPVSGLPNGLLGVSGLGGNDTIQGSPIADRIFGNRGADRLFGQEGADTIRGGSGSDELAGGIGNDSLAGDRGGDWLRGGAGDDELQGGPGDDVLIGGSGRGCSTPSCSLWNATAPCRWPKWPRPRSIWPKTASRCTARFNTTSTSRNGAFAMSG